MKIIITFLYALALYWLVLPGMSQMKWVLGGTEQWSRSWDQTEFPLLPHSRAPAERCEQHLPFSSPGPLAVSLSLHRCLRVSVLLLTRSHPAQAIPEDTACPVSLPVNGEGWQSSWTSPGSCWKPPLLPSWEALARAVSLYCPCLNGDSDGFQAGRTSLSKILHGQEMQLFGDILKQKEIKDRKGCGNLTTCLWGGGSGRASTRQGRSWHSERPREEKGFNLSRTPAKSITTSATQLLFPRHQLQWPSSKRKLHLVWGHTSAP